MGLGVWTAGLERRRRRLRPRRLARATSDVRPPARPAAGLRRTPFPSSPREPLPAHAARPPARPSRCLLRLRLAPARPAEGRIARRPAGRGRDGVADRAGARAAAAIARPMRRRRARRPPWGPASGEGGSGRAGEGRAPEGVRAHLPPLPPAVPVAPQPARGGTPAGGRGRRSAPRRSGSRAGQGPSRERPLAGRPVLGPAGAPPPAGPRGLHQAGRERPQDARGTRWAAAGGRAGPGVRWPDPAQGRFLCSCACWGRGSYPPPQDRVTSALPLAQAGLKPPQPEHLCRRPPSPQAD